MASKDAGGTIVNIAITDGGLPSAEQRETLLKQGHHPSEECIQRLSPMREWRELVPELRRRGFCISNEGFAYGNVAIAELDMQSGPIPPDVAERFADTKT